MIESILLVVVTALATWFIARWVRSEAPRDRILSHEEKEIGRAKDIGSRLDGARDRASQVEIERNKLALAKAVKAALWVTESRLNFAVPELLKLAQLWVGQSVRAGKKWKAPEGVTQVEGLDDLKSPWAAWNFRNHHWRIEGQWRPSILPEEIEEDIGTCKVLLDNEIVLDMTISSKDRHVMWIDALTVGPWVSDLLSFAGAQKSDAQALSSAKSALQNQKRADNIHWS
ncbi:MAG: hypothetical protein H0V46_06800 [Sphingomonas sp.]|nr:hypothetical protein [Sphingomonas sp.]